MGKQVAVAFLLIFLIFFLPFLWGEADVLPAVPPAGDAAQPPVPDTDPAPTRYDASATITVLLDGQAQQMDLQTYLMGVVRAEMPAAFELEALKAQAVAARTYTLHKIANGGSANHPDADACNDIGCCQAFKSYEDAAAGWGVDAQAFEEKIRQAVEDTDGECILYEGEPVLAVFHSSSAGVTQDASAVWSESLPYLQSVETPESAETVPNYCSTVSFSAEELKNKLQAALPEANLSGSPSNWFTNMRQEPNGTVTAVSVGGVTVSGTKLRAILELRSACFTVSFDGGTVTFSVTGYGHGVGMSQYGANVLAADGMGYQEILTWYYTGTAIGRP
ncbi:MAG: stage II sporulation protein D [Oscillospiraceae bacterium]|nr:stage II sporulation protein D [Oscillospiraceae bacterium]